MSIKLTSMIAAGGSGCWDMVLAFEPVWQRPGTKRNRTMDEKVKLADAYYDVARDIRRQVAWLTEIANTLEGIADKICEANIRNTPLPTDSAEGSRDKA